MPQSNEYRMETCMWRMVRIVLIGAGLAASTATAPAAEPQEQTADVKCRKAEINPVTGHVLCLDPRGAPVEAPAEALRPECKPEEARGQWSWGPNCTPTPGEM
jgi:hypothetical protein